MDLCQNTSDETHATVSKISYEILDEKLRGAEFNTMVSIIQDLDGNKPEAFPLLYQFKKEDISSKIDMSKEVASYYKSGKNDPSRVIGFEKMRKK